MLSNVPTGGDIKELQQFYTTVIVLSVCEMKGKQPASMGQNLSALQVEKVHVVYGTGRYVPRQQESAALSNRETDGYVLCCIVT